MTGIGSSEILLILFIATIVAGSGNVRKVLSGSGKMIRRIKTFACELMGEGELSEEIDDIKRDIENTAISVQKELDFEGMEEEIEQLKRNLKKCTDKLKSMKK